MAVSFTRELDSVKFPARNLASPRKVKRKWHSREDRRHDKQYGDAVLVPSDGGVCLSGRNPMTQIGQSGGWSLMDLILEVMMRLMMALPCWFLVTDLVARN
ncbi:hypothetical protein GH714_016908 [Hevea brasiliensis]|uniref:Uncharacterized protein n=1 Tax=Hevea brasiliensis TaxID=3981 RepID=A0A6A6K527_HEVBR|nr:hypothetical protein GH714_016908 [Hevea brasiliensis]